MAHRFNPLPRIGDQEMNFEFTEKKLHYPWVRNEYCEKEEGSCYGIAH